MRGGQSIMKSATTSFGEWAAWRDEPAWLICRERSIIRPMLHRGPALLYQMKGFDDFKTYYFSRTQQSSHKANGWKPSYCSNVRASYIRNNDEMRAPLVGSAFKHYSWSRGYHNTPFKNALALQCAWWLYFIGFKYQPIELNENLTNAYREAMWANEMALMQ